ncbi:hypothetical protein FC98_GL000003 [Lentilactobacillus kisonensis DSM 19906 = JCM 15041]|uniref:Prepilin-type cleavage/methylation protein n=2 Tax=Lentilactobacillus kisonensis TaxID=481722 RepID=H1LJK3_9LACO|nr:prepilin-type cleavage/methylation protein [Lentilactobacillus kisonensis F0435]KRL23281.1 hypothetical protein FC98_GL000003 [Lentilactobacillus kisonensis DSM 19906 = JCM 15041]
MVIVLRKWNKKGFTAIDSLIGLTIISAFSLFYIHVTTQMNQNIDDSQRTMIVERKNYEKTIQR